MTTVTTPQEKTRRVVPVKAREMMEQLNLEAADLNFWLRTEMNDPSQKAWFADTSGAGQKTHRPHLGQSAQGAPLPLALARLRSVSRPHLANRRRSRRSADRICRPPEHPVNESRVSADACR